MLVTALSDVDTAFEANFCELLLREIIDVLHVEKKVFISELAEKHVELPSDKYLGHFVDDRGVNRDLHLKQSQNIIERVKTSHRRDTHKVSHVDQTLRLEHVELPVLCKQVSVLK